jgi:hypothetical protein
LCKYYYIFKVVSAPIKNTKTSQKPSTYTRRLFVLSFKERLP